MVDRTPNHGLHLYEPGDTDWSHSEDMAVIEERLVVRALDAVRTEYEPHPGATFVAIDTGAVYDGDGSQWVPATRTYERLRATDGRTEHLAVDDVFRIPEYDDRAEMVDAIDGGRAYLGIVDGSLEVIDATPVSAIDDRYLRVAFDDEGHVGSHPDRNEIVPDPSGLGDVLKVGFPEKGDVYGASWSYHAEDYFEVDYDDPIDDAHARFDVYVPEAFEYYDVHPHGGGKLPGFADRRNPAADDAAGWGSRDPRDDDRDGWGGRLNFYKPGHSWGNEADGAAGLGTQLSHYASSVDGYSEAVGGGPLGEEPARWVQVDQYVQMNDPGEANGVLVVWVDGEERYRKDDVMYRDEDATFLGAHEFWFNVYYGGSHGAQRDDEWIAFRDLELWWDHGPQLPLHGNSDGSLS